MSQRRLLWINHFAVLPDSGGGTRHFEMGRELTRLGWSVAVAASDFDLYRRTYVRRSGRRDRGVLSEVVDRVTFRWHWAAPYQVNNWRRGWNWLSFSRSVVNANTTRTADVVIGSSPHLFAALAGYRLARKWRVPFVLEVRDLWPESIVAAGGRKGVAYAVLRRLADFLYSRADRVVCLTRGTQNYLAEYGIPADKLAYVPNGVDTHAFTSSESDRGDPVFTLVYAGAHGPANGLETVIEAADRLRDNAGIRFVLIGDGPAKTDLVNAARARALPNLEFRAPVPKLEMQEVLRSADAGLMVLRDAPLFAFGVSPNKLFDYFGAGLPVVSNVQGEVASMIQAAGAGEQAVDASPAALVDAVMRLARSHGSIRKGMGMSARAWVEKEHNRTILAARLDGILRELV